MFPQAKQQWASPPRFLHLLITTKMLKSTVQKILRHLAMRYGKFPGLYIKFCNPSSEEYTEFLRRHGNLYAIGSNCSILPSTIFADPAYVRIGNNVHLSSCTLIGHDGSIAMLNRAYNVKLDSVGKIDIGDNVFIGYGAIVLPNVTISSNAIVGADAVVTKDVAERALLAASPPGLTLGSSTRVKKLPAQTPTLPGADLINSRDGSFEPEIEPQVVK